MTLDADNKTSLYEKVLSACDNDIDQALKWMENEEKKLYYLKHQPLREIDIIDFLINRTQTEVCEELLELDLDDMEDIYEYEANTGMFELDFDPIPYYEGIKFGKWITDEFISCIEKGRYEINKEDPTYLTYRKKLKELTLKRICEIEDIAQLLN